MYGFVKFRIYDNFPSDSNQLSLVLFTTIRLLDILIKSFIQKSIEGR